MQTIYKILLSFVRFPDPRLLSFTDNLIAKLTSNPNFPTVDPALSVITAALAAFRNAVNTMKQGGTQATKARDAARNALIALLRALVLDIQKQSQGDPVKMLSSGFDIYTNSNAQYELDQPVIIGIENGASGQVILHVTPLDGARCYEIQFCGPDGVWKSAPSCSQARTIPVPGLTPGLMYQFRVRGVGGATGFSDWSDPVSHMAT
jgi:hypothetical protein